MTHLPPLSARIVPQRLPEITFPVPSIGMRLKIFEWRFSLDNASQDLQRRHRMGAVTKIDLEIGGRNALLPAQYSIQERFIAQVMPAPSSQSILPRSCCPIHLLRV